MCKHIFIPENTFAPSHLYFLYHRHLYPIILYQHQKFCLLTLATKILVSVRTLMLANACYRVGRTCLQRQTVVARSLVPTANIAKSRLLSPSARLNLNFEQLRFAVS